MSESEWQAISAASNSLMSSVDEHQLLADLCDNAITAGRNRLAWYGRLARDGSYRIVPLASAGAALDHLAGLEVKWDLSAGGRGPEASAARSGRFVTVGDTGELLGHDSVDTRAWMSRAGIHGLRSHTSIPVRVNGQVDGVLCIYSDAADAFDALASSIHHALCQQAGAGLERLQLVKNALGALSETIRVLSATLEARDPYTAGHQASVSTWSERIARRMGMDDFQSQGVSVAALVHDIGKVGVPIELLLRPTILRPAERQLIETHAAIGEEVLAGITFAWPIAQITGQHHERLNGSGYPRGIDSDDILPAAKIVMVADVFDAMTADRPYRRGHSRADALDFLVSGKGCLFDAGVVDALSALAIEDVVMARSSTKDVSRASPPALRGEELAPVP